MPPVPSISTRYASLPPAHDRARPSSCRHDGRAACIGPPPSRPFAPPKEASDASSMRRVIPSPRLRANRSRRIEGWRNPSRSLASPTETREAPKPDTGWRLGERLVQDGFGGRAIGNHARRQHAGTSVAPAARPERGDLAIGRHLHAEPASQAVTCPGHPTVRSSLRQSCNV